MSAIGANPELLNNLKELRAVLLDFIADFCDWNNADNESFLNTSRLLTSAAAQSFEGISDKPLVIDPFAGGGSIPLEALRIGADAFASDLNPVAVMLNRVLVQFIPKYGERLAERVRFWGGWVRKHAFEELAQFFPEDASQGTAIAYLWARTIRCEGPSCGTEIPLLTHMTLSERKHSEVAIKLQPHTRRKFVEIQLATKSEAKECGEGLLRRSSATCPVCGYTTSAERVRAQFKGRAGGANDARLLAVVCGREENVGKSYRLPNEKDFAAIAAARRSVARLRNANVNGIPAIPDEQLPYLRSIFNVNLLDVNTWGELFSDRQLLSLTAFAKFIRTAAESEEPELRQAIRACLALGLDRLADYNSSLCRWVPKGEFLGNTFGRQALGIVWDFAECNPLSHATGNWLGAIEWIARVVERQAKTPSATVELGSATRLPLPNDSVQVFCTDPPYYDLVPYADLSDFFYVWLRRTVGQDFPDLFKTDRTPKREEIVQLAERNKEYSYKTKENYERLMEQAMTEVRRVLVPSGIGVVFFAHKGTGAWESQLQSMIRAGWTICGSWPIDTERGARLRAMNSATLASSIQLVCRPRKDSGGNVGDWREVLRELPERIHNWMPRLSTEGVVGADAIFACIGPALEIFSRYERVEKANGEQIQLSQYLEQVWAAVAREALAMVFRGADATGFEEDARLSAMWLWTLFAGESGNGELPVEGRDDDEEAEESGGTQKGFVLEYDAARKIAQGLGAHLESLTSLVEVKGEVARLLPLAERTRRLFGKDESEAPTSTRRKKSSQLQLGFVAELEQAEETGSWGSKGAPTQGATVLDRVHQAMILFAAGRGEALRRFLVDEGVGRDQRLWRLSQVLSFLYPKASDEKRWIDGVLARKKGLGF